MSYTIAGFFAVVIVPLSTWISGIITYDNEMTMGAFILQLFVKSIVTVVSSSIQVFFWVTFAFIFLERVGDSTSKGTFWGKQWTPGDL
jgi:hypothetical protein